MAMRSLLADTVIHRARFAWLAALLVASVVAFVLTRPTAPRFALPVWQDGRCIEGAIRVDRVPSYHRHQVERMPVYVPDVQLR
jgi:hypothetical protein